MTAEGRRLLADARRDQNWKRWGPYLAERQWGTVREEMGLALIRSCGIRFSDSAWESLSFTALSTLTSPARN